MFCSFTESVPTIMEFVNEIFFNDGPDWIDVKKKLKGDFIKDGDLSSLRNLEKELSVIASKLFDCLPSVMQDKLLSGADNCSCRFNFHANCSTAELGSGDCNEIQDSSEVHVAMIDVCSVICPSVTTPDVTLDHAKNQDSFFTNMDSPTEMPVDLNLVADDYQLLDATSDVALQKKSPIVQCSESSMSATIRDVSEMEQFSSTVPEQVAGELETISCSYTKELAEPLLKLDVVEKYVNSGNTVMSEQKKQAEPLQRLKIAPRNLSSTDSLSIESVCELRHAMSVEEQETCSAAGFDAKDEVGHDGYFQRPQPPGTPPALMGSRIIKLLETKKHRIIIQYMDNHLGQGGFGSVFKAYDQDTGILLAIKKIKFMKEDHDTVLKEVHILDGLCHRNIVSVLGSQVQDMECQIFLEWMAGGSVQELLNKYAPLSAMVIQSYSEQVLSGIAYLHKWEILHCDIKSANIVVDSTGQVAKLCDFGLAMKMPVHEGTKAQGTLPFMAPEVSPSVVITSGWGNY